MDTGLWVQKNRYSTWLALVNGTWWAKILRSISGWFNFDPYPAQPPNPPTPHKANPMGVLVGGFYHLVSWCCWDTFYIFWLIVV